MTGIIAPSAAASPGRITTKRVLIDGKETGIDHLDWIFGEVKNSPWITMMPSRKRS